MARHDGSDFWRNLDVLLAAWQVVIDRPKGSAHPMYAKAIYPVDYGYLTGTQAADGDGVDVWRGTAEAGAFDAVVCTVDPVKKDVEVKFCSAAWPRRSGRSWTSTRAGCSSSAPYSRGASRNV